MNAPIDEIHEMQINFIRWVRFEINKMKREVAIWQPRRCPPK